MGLEALPKPAGRAEGLRVRVTANGQWFYHHVFLIKLCKTPGRTLESFRVAKGTEGWLGWPSDDLVICVLRNILHGKAVNINIFLSPGSHTSKLVEPPEQPEGIPGFIARASEA